MKGWHCHLPTLSLMASAFSACQMGINPGDPTDLKITGNMAVTHTLPEQNATEVFLDQEVQFAFDNKIDTTSVHPSEVEIWDTTGNRVPSKDIQVGGRFAGDQSILKIAKKSGWSPLTTYYVALRGLISEGSNPYLAGIRSIDGEYLRATSIAFTSGDKYSDEDSSSTPQVREMSPGRVLLGSETSGDQSFAGAFGDAITVVNNTGIKIRFSTPMMHYAVDTTGSAVTAEIPRTPSDQFPGLVVGLMDSQSSVADFAQSAKAATSPQGWSQFTDRVFSQKLKGFVHTENARRLLVFELDPNCPNKQECTYPDNSDLSHLAQVVVVMIRGFVSTDHSRPMKLDPTIGSFVHISGYKVGEGYQTISGSLGGIMKGVFGN